MEKLNLPEFEFKVREESGQREIFDFIRKKFVLLTPEEWVRQNFVRFLIEIKQYPAGLCVIEKEIRVGDLRRRPDLVVYSKTGMPVMIVEFKAPKVSVNEEVLFQAALYNKKLQVPYLMLSNGHLHYCLEIALQTGQMKFLDDIPAYHEL